MILKVPSALVIGREIPGAFHLPSRAVRFGFEDGDAEMKVEVVCYSGYKGDERPVRFRLGGQDYFVEELLDQWYGPQDIFFKVERTTAMCTSFGAAHLCLKGNGAWNRSVT